MVKTKRVSQNYVDGKAVGENGYFALIGQVHYGAECRKRLSAKLVWIDTIIGKRRCKEALPFFRAFVAYVVKRFIRAAAPIHLTQMRVHFNRNAKRVSQRLRS